MPSSDDLECAFERILIHGENEYQKMQHVKTRIKIALRNQDTKHGQVIIASSQPHKYTSDLFEPCQLYVARTPTEWKTVLTKFLDGDMKIKFLLLDGWNDQEQTEDVCQSCRATESQSCIHAWNHVQRLLDILLVHQAKRNIASIVIITKALDEVAPYFRKRFPIHLNFPLVKSVSHDTNTMQT